MEQLSFKLKTNLHDTYNVGEQCQRSLHADPPTVLSDMISSTKGGTWTQYKQPSEDSWVFSYEGNWIQQQVSIQTSILFTSLISSSLQSDWLITQ